GRRDPGGEPARGLRARAATAAGFSLVAPSHLRELRGPAHDPVRAPLSGDREPESGKQPPGPAGRLPDPRGAVLRLDLLGVLPESSARGGGVRARRGREPPHRILPDPAADEQARGRRRRDLRARVYRERLTPLVDLYGRRS